MRIIGHGIDLVAIERIEKIVARHDQHFLDRVFTAGEQRYANEHKSPAIRLAGRFAVKEAVLKVLGTGWRGGLEFKHIEALPDEYGKPHLLLRDFTRRYAEELGITAWHISISHAGGFAIGSAIGSGA